MAQAMLSVPISAEVKEEMGRHREIRWVEVARQAIIDHLDLLERMDKLLAKSKFTEQDAVKHGKRVNQSLLNRFKKGRH